MHLKAAKVAGLNLSQLLPELVLPECAQEMIVQDMHLDSRKVTPGTLFFAKKGFTINREERIEAAFSSGAIAIVKEGERDAWEYYSKDNKALIIQLKGMQSRIGKIASDFFGNPSEHMTLVGITGTNGKTSCADYLLQLWTAQNIVAASLGTLGWRVANGEYHHTGLTTLDVVENHRMMSRFIESNIHHVVMEVSSHGIHQERIGGLDFDVKAITNISRDHLDYHGSYEAYVDTKLSFLAGHKNENFKTVVNLDDKEIRKVISSTVDNENQISYALRDSSAKVHCTDLHKVVTGFRAKVAVNDASFDSNINLIGEFNIANVLLVVGVLTSLGGNLEALKASLPKIRPAWGRLQNINNIFVDYAHTPDALENVLKALRDHCKNKLIVVFGCGGDRDKGKRPLMAIAAERYADSIFVTSDNPRSENPSDIVDEIVAGFSANTECVIELDRARAIKQAISIASEEDIVLVAGKGHESYQYVQGETIPFDDLDEIKKVLAYT